MRSHSIRRRLAALFSADVKGYSRLMGDDEVETVRTLIASREVMTARILQYGGRVVDAPGDNLLAEFASVVDAVQCAVDIQQELTTRNAALPLHRRMEFRIGINLGDVLVEDERIYGDDVNITARIEELAEAGGICLSGTAYDQIDTKLALSCVYLGEHTVKNIAKPVRVYRVVREGDTARSPGRLAHRVQRQRRPWMALAVTLGLLLLVSGAVAVWHLPWRPPAAALLAIPDKPSIVVLPFANLSNDPQQEYFSDGMTEELITALSKYSELFVIARTSAFTYKDKAVRAQQVGQELGVRYVLEGSVRTAADTVRITAQLIDATTGHHLWAERYDRARTDIFALQDEITRQIVMALQVQLTEGEQAHVWHYATENLAAYELFLRGRALAVRKTPQTLAQARQLFEQAIALDPQFAVAYVHLGWLHHIEARFGWSATPATALQQAQALAHRAVALEVNNAAIFIDNGPPSQLDIEVLRRTYDTNFFGTFAVLKAMLPLLKKSEAGRVVNLSSGLGSLAQTGTPDYEFAPVNLLAYNSSKTALNALTVQLANELRSTPVKINSADPGYVATDLNNHAGYRTVEQGAKVIVRLATLPADGPAGGFFDENGTVPW